MSQAQPSILQRAAMGLLVATILLAGLEGMLRWMWGPAPNPVRVFGALGAHDQFLALEDGAVRRLYGESPLPPFP